MAGGSSGAGPEYTSRGDGANAVRHHAIPLNKSGWSGAAGSPRNRLQSSPGPRSALSPSRRHACSKRPDRRRAYAPSPRMRWPKRGSLSRPPRSSRSSPSTRPARAEPGAGRGGPWLEHPLQAVVECGETHHHRGEAQRCELGEQVEVAQDQRALGHDRDWVAVHDTGRPYGDPVPLTAEAMRMAWRRIWRAPTIRYKASADYRSRPGAAGRARDSLGGPGKQRPSVTNAVRRVTGQDSWRRTLRDSPAQLRTSRRSPTSRT